MAAPPTNDDKHKNRAVGPLEQSRSQRQRPSDKDPPEIYEGGVTEDEISPHPGIGGILADPKGETDRRGG